MPLVVGTDEATPSILTVKTEVMNVNDFDIPQSSNKRMGCEIELNEVPSTKNDTTVETEIAAINSDTPSISNQKKRDQEATVTAYPPSPTEVPPPIPIDRSIVVCHLIIATLDQSRQLHPLLLPLHQT